MRTLKFSFGQQFNTITVPDSFWLHYVINVILLQVMKTRVIVLIKSFYQQAFALLYSSLRTTWLFLTPYSIRFLMSAVTPPAISLHRVKTLFSGAVLLRSLLQSTNSVTKETSFLTLCIASFSATHVFQFLYIFRRTHLAFSPWKILRDIVEALRYFLALWKRNFLLNVAPLGYDETVLVLFQLVPHQP